MPFLRMATMILQTILVDGYGSKLKAWPQILLPILLLV